MNSLRTDQISTAMQPGWHNQMETFSAWLALCARNSPVTGEFPSQRPVTRSFDVFFHLCLNKGLSTVNNREAGDLRRHRAHYDVIVMIILWMCDREYCRLSINPQTPKQCQQNVGFFANHTFKCMFFNENSWVEVRTWITNIHRNQWM